MKPIEHQHGPAAPAPRGLTLIELLVVMTILVLLISSAIPVVSPSGDERRIREASRGVNSFLAGAQARAVRSGRPFGVLLKKLSQETGSADDNAVCLELSYVEQPGPYSGFDASSRVIVTRPFPLRPIVACRFVRQIGLSVSNFQVQPGWEQDLFPPGVFHPGDTIVIGGLRYELLAPTDNRVRNITGGLRNLRRVPVDQSGFFSPNSAEAEPLVFAIAVDGVTPELVPRFDNQGDRLTQPVATLDAPEPYWTEPLPYEIRRRPVETSAPPYQLPEGVAIDLRASGVGEESFLHRDDPGDNDRTNNNLPVMIMFSPEGSVDRLIAGLDANLVNNLNDADLLVGDRVSSDIYLLVGLRENILAPTVDAASITGTDEERRAALAEYNWLNGDARWVTIGSQTGSVTTTENAFVNVSAIANAADAPDALADRRDREIFAAREFAATKSSLGGK